MNCPYCGNRIEPDWDYCKNCNKPLIVKLYEKKSRSISRILDKDVVEQNHYQKDDELYEIKDEKIDKKIDEINKIIEQKQNLEDSIGKLLLEKAILFQKKKDLSTSLKIFELALDNFIAEDDFFNIAVSHNEIGLIHEENGFFDQAIYHFEQSISNLKEMNSPRSLILVYNNLANVYYLLKDLEHSYEFYDKALKLAEQYNFISEEIKTYSNLVDILFLLKNYDEAKKILNRNLEYFRQIGDLYGIIVSVIKLGKLGYYLGVNSYKTSHKNLVDALDLISLLKDKTYQSVKAELKWECYLYLGKLNLLYNNYEEAKDYLYKSLEEIRLFELEESLHEAKILKNLAKLYEIKGEYQKAIEIYYKSQEIYYKFGDEYKVAQLLRKIAWIYLDNLKNESEAIKNYENALEIFEDQNYFKESADVLHRLGDIYVNNGIIEIALSNWERAKRYYADLLDEVNLNLITEKIKSLDNSNSERF